MRRLWAKIPPYLNVLYIVDLHIGALGPRHQKGNLIFGLCYMCLRFKALTCSEQFSYS